MIEVFHEFIIGSCVFSIESFAKSIIDTANEHDINAAELNYIYGDDDWLLDYNVRFLDHNTYTDIITFVNNEDPLEVDFLISLERVKDNSESIGEKYSNEALRVMFHGFLHVCGYKDKSEEDVKVMREMEDKCLALYFKYVSRETN
jgi:probable rRNA maturation factor